jgi:hypothetical protein
MEMTNNKQQMAVEWFAEKTFNQIELLKHLCINEEQFLNNMLFFREQAKEMEKERTINFTEDWYFNGPLLGEGIDVKNTIEKHFNNTYGGGEQ